MKKKMIKKILTAAMTVSILSSFGTMTASAETSMADTMGGVLVSGEISTDLVSATAKTICPSAAAVSVKARVDYWYGTQHYYSTAYASTNGGTAVATAIKKIDGAEVTGGRGYYYVSFDTYYWRSASQTGEMYSDATML